MKDGALLLARVVVSPVVLELAQQRPNEGVHVEFGAVNDDTNPTSPENSFALLPSRQGQLLSLDDSAFIPQAATLLRESFGIEMPAQTLPDGRVVLAARLYRPPNEFDTANVTTADERKINLGFRLSGVLSLTGAKPNALWLTRPPVVLVHGINSNPETWTEDNGGPGYASFVDSAEAAGFKARHFRVDHSGLDPARPEEGATLGYGEITSMYAQVRDHVRYAVTSFQSGVVQSGAIAPPLPLFRGIGDQASKRIAVQKADIVAHSYGGLLSRWYVEQSPEFETRRDVRKLITLGTPHNGSPLANMVAEVYKHGLIASAKAQGIGSVELSMYELLRLLDNPAHGGSQDLLPNALLPDRQRPRHAFEVFSVNSARLAQLNQQPFHNDVAYGSIVGKKHSISKMYAPIVYPYTALQPIYGTESLGDDVSLFPWLYTLDGGGEETDSIVPVWSQRLALADFIEEEHIWLQKRTAAQTTVFRWLNGKSEHGIPEAMPRGAVHRAAFDPHPPVSQRNAYVGSKIMPDGTSRGAGLNRDAIVKVELNPSDTTSDYGKSLYLHGDDRGAGVRPVALTGMMRVADLGAASFRIIADEALTDDVLHDLGTVATADLNVAPAALVGAGPNDWVPFRVTRGRIGRKVEQAATGPDGHSSTNLGHYLAYEVTTPGSSSPPVSRSASFYLATFEFQLPTPTFTNAAGAITLAVRGAVPARGVGTGTYQVNTVRLWDDDLLSNTLLDDVQLTLTHAGDVWDGLLLPYSASFNLMVDGAGLVVGHYANTDEEAPDVFQEVTDVFSWYDPDSESVTLP